ncbi:hypothetical protein ACQEV2_09845 [Streptomyces sp. CA-251387]|uniref:hypothetical protein n=1 Tax=Streptomyces sp. CA-251387 TaxID=3240064 RepID=UPI003D8B640E
MAERGTAQGMTTGTEYATTRDVVLLIAVLLVLTVTLAMVLVQSWPPPPAPGGGTAGPDRTQILFWTPDVSLDTRLFLVVVAAGGLGALIHVLRSAYEYVGNRRLRRSWLTMYLLEPFVGATLALVAYCVLRGGLTTSVASSGDINPYGTAAVAALVGMFSRQTVDKLRAVFNTLLAPPQDSPGEGLPRPSSPESPAPSGSAAPEGGAPGSSDPSSHR